ncbi:hypothetical protein PSHT_09846 [Puccinia striiformis]|uniref:SUN domain-containing protein n=1 Tax=Puccinia striiformis TaxID=27350 RepID=A0A2S4VDZ3_9BASI|nr:hypothetical protein PSHT_09846 [Puccinia striiformis]
MYAKENFLHLLHSVALIHSATAAIPTSKSLSEIDALRRIPSRWRAVEPQCVKLTGFGKQFMDKNGELRFLHNGQVQLTAQIVEMYPKTDITNVQEVIEKEVDRLDQKHPSPPGSPLHALQIFNPIRGSVVTLAIIDTKNHIKLENFEIPGGLPAKHYELAEGYEPSKILFSVDAIHDHCLRSSVSNVQLPRPDFPPQSSVLRSDMSSFRRNDPLTRLSNPTLFGWIWIPGWSWIRTIIDYMNYRAS